MPLINCSACAAPISDAATACPRCGHPHPRAPEVRRSQSSRWLVYLVEPLIPALGLALITVIVIAKWHYLRTFIPSKERDATNALVATWNDNLGSLKKVFRLTEGKHDEGLKTKEDIEQLIKTGSRLAEAVGIAKDNPLLDSQLRDSASRLKSLTSELWAIMATEKQWPERRDNGDRIMKMLDKLDLEQALFCQRLNNISIRIGGITSAANYRFLVSVLAL